MIEGKLEMDEIYVFDKNDEDSKDYFNYYVLNHLKTEVEKHQVCGCTNVLENILTRVFKTQEKITVVIDDSYIDKIYRDCYYTHFSGKHFEYSRYCKRVFLFGGDCCDFVKENDECSLQECFIGCFVVKPLKVGTIGRTLFNPKYMFDEETTKVTYVRTSRYYVHLNGMQLFVDAFPYSMQDSETLTCAESTLLDIFDYYSNQYSDYRFMLPSEMFDVAKTNGCERTLPSHGMSYTLMSKIMVEFGFYPRLYMKESIRDDEELVRTLSYYVESAIPVAIGLRTADYYNHSIACIGHGKNKVENMMEKLYRISAFDTDDTHKGDKRVLFIADSANTIDEYVVMDDNLEPYSIYKTSVTSDDLISKKEIKLNDSQILCLAVPLYKRMYLEANDARAICMELLKEKAFSFEAQYEDMFSKKVGIRNNPIIMRLFLASSRSFKRERILTFNNDDICRQIYSITPFPQFVWVCELYDLEYYNKSEPLGEIVLDATSTANTKPFDSIIMMNYPGKYLMKDYDGKSTGMIQTLMDGLEIPIYSGKIYNCEFLAFESKLDHFKMYKKNLYEVSHL